MKGVCVLRQGENNSVTQAARERERERERERGWGSKPGSGGAASAQNEAVDRRERLRRLALETIDVAKDPYFMRNHLGGYSLSLSTCFYCISPLSLGVFFLAEEFLAMIGLRSRGLVLSLSAGGYVSRCQLDS